jgi:hypothetical protein
VTPSTQADTPAYTYDLARAVAFDLECYPDRWCVGFFGPDRNGKPIIFVVDGDPARLAAVLSRLAEHGRTLIGYNSERFDLPVIRGILHGLDPYELAQSIIRENRAPRSLSRLPGLPCDHIDLAARLRRGGGFPSLKAVAANLGRPILRELPYPPDATLTDKQWGEVRRYNAVDLGHTWALAEQFSPELQALATLSRELGRDLRSTPTPRVCELVLLDAYRRAHGVEPRRPEPPQEVLYRPVPGVTRPRIPEAAAWFDQVSNRPLRVVAVGDRLRVDVPQATFAIGGLSVSVRAGGLHSVDRARVYYSTRRHRVVSVDVASFYPTLIATRGIAPRSYGGTGATIYKSILDRRLAIKQQAKAAQDPAERERLEVQANALKLVLNSTFGKYGDSYSTLFDPGAMLAVTLSGQLMLIDLIERLTAVGVRVLSANTDGLFIRVRRRGKRWQEVLAEWQRDTQMTLEVEPLRRLAILATNRFATLDPTGKIKRKGDGLKGSLSPLAAPNSLVVNDGVAAALLLDIPPERVIWQCRDPVRFCRVTRRSSKVIQGVLLDEGTGEEAELPRVARWYRARGSTRRIVHRLEGGRHTTPANAIGVELAPELVDGRLPDDLDRGWYVAQARKKIQGVAGYRHRSRRRLDGNPTAARVLALGLTPVPKWAGKAMLPGSDPKAPTLLWDWERARTLGCYTGPKVGTLVLDVDDPVLFRKWVDRGNAPLLADRWRELEGCLVSVRGAATAEDVRAGRARGNLIFRLEGDEEHPLAKLSINRWKKTRGVEIFYGKGLPSILGEHPDGDHYRLEGTLTDAPTWLVDGLSPTPGRPKPIPGSNAQLAHPGPEPSANGRHEPSANGRCPAGPGEVDTTELEGLPGILAGLRPELGRESVGWRTKDLPDGRMILVGRCPYEHDSGTSSDTDLSAGFDEHGIPSVRCLHSSCTIAREINAPLAARYARTRRPAIEPPVIEPTGIAGAIMEDLASPSVALHQAPTGSGKTYSLCQAAALRARQGRPTLIAVPTLRLAYEIADTLAEIAPDLVLSDALALACGHRPGRSDDGDPEEGPDAGRTAARTRPGSIRSASGRGSSSAPTPGSAAGVSRSSSAASGPGSGPSPLGRRRDRRSP